MAKSKRSITFDMDLINKCKSKQKQWNYLFLLAWISNQEMKQDCYEDNKQKMRVADSEYSLTEALRSLCHQNAKGLVCCRLLMALASANFQICWLILLQWQLEVS